MCLYLCNHVCILLLLKLNERRQDLTQEISVQPDCECKTTHRFYRAPNKNDQPKWFDDFSFLKIKKKKSNFDQMIFF